MAKAHVGNAVVASGVDSDSMTLCRPAIAGSRVNVIAPSGPVPAQRCDKGLKVLRRHGQFDVALAENLLEQQGFLAGSDATRLAAMHRAFADEDARAVIAARGGYGATRLLGSLDPSRLAHAPKLIVGFSDITALLCWAWVAAGLRSIHGPVVTQLSTLCDEDVLRLVDLMRGEIPPPLSAEQGTVVRGGTVEGPLIAGNIEVLRSLVGTRFMPPLAGAILAVEDVGELPYRIDRALTQMLSAGALRGVRGIVVGQLVNCASKQSDPIGPSAHDVVVERLETLGVPVVTGFGFGHSPDRNAALPFGSPVRLDADDCTLTVLEPVAE